MPALLAAMLEEMGRLTSLVAAQSAQLDDIRVQVEAISAENAELKTMLSRSHSERGDRTDDLTFMPCEDDGRSEERQPAAALSAEAMSTAHVHHAGTSIGEAEVVWARLGASIDDVATRTSLGNSALLPFYEVLSACGISRDVGDRLREEGILEPVIVNESKNPRLYLTLGAWRGFVKKCKLAPPPSQSRLSRAKKQKRR